MSENRRISVWNSASLVFGLDPQFWRIDPEGRTIHWGAYGNRNSTYGWEIGHITALADGGFDAFFNIQAEHWITNLQKEAFRRQQEQNFGNIFGREGCRREPFQYWGNRQ